MCRLWFVIWGESLPGVYAATQCLQRGLVGERRGKKNIRFLVFLFPSEILSQSRNALDLSLPSCTVTGSMVWAGRGDPQASRKRELGEGSERGSLPLTQAL